MDKARWKVIEVLPDGTGDTLREERFYDEYRFALDHVLQAAAVYNGTDLYDVAPLRSNLRGDLSFTVMGAGDDDFLGYINLERTYE